jgi:homoserine O-acetyltransferase/O-succinyltransferase
MKRIAGSLVVFLAVPLAWSQEPPRATQAECVLKDFRFASGETLAELKIHYRTFGTPKKDDQGVVRNAVLILHGTTGSGANFTASMFSGSLFGPGQPLDVTKNYIILADGIGHGQSSKPSDGMHAKFPRYGYGDMIAAQHRLLTEGLGIDHLRLVMGTSMGGMHTWLWGQTYPDFMDGLVPLASLPTQISGRNRFWRNAISDAIRNDPQWKSGEYTEQPPSLRTAIGIMTLMSDSPVNWYNRAPTLAKADGAFENAVTTRLARSDTNDLLYAVEASHDYDPAPGLNKIKAPLLAINFADDLINPPEIGILEREIKRVPRGKAVLIPAGPETVGHGTHTKAAVWKHLLMEFLKEIESKNQRLPNNQ